MSVPPLKPGAVLCRDGSRFAVEDVGGRLVVTTPAGDPFLAPAGLSPFADAAQVRDGVVRHSGVPIETVRALVRAHAGFEAAGPLALAILQAAGRPPAPETAPSTEAPPAVEEAAQRPFADGRRLSRPAPRIPPDVQHVVTPPPEAMISQSTG